MIYDLFLSDLLIKSSSRAFLCINDNINIHYDLPDFVGFSVGRYSDTLIVSSNSIMSIWKLLSVSFQMKIISDEFFIYNKNYFYFIDRKRTETTYL